MRSPISRFSYVQSDINMKRSQFGRPHRHLTTLSAGKLYPLLVDEVLPGDTYSVDVSSLVRMSTPIHPVMDNLFLDIAFFYTPNRILWQNWKSFMGESPEDPYINSIEYSVPQLKASLTALGPKHIPPKSVMDYMGLPSGTIVESVNALPFRGFAKIWNEWYRDQNLQNAIDIDYGDTDHPYATLNLNYVTDCARGGSLPPVNKFHDYFTSASLEPQKGNAVPIPLSGFAPVYGNEAFVHDPIGDPLHFTNDGSDDVNGDVFLLDGKINADNSYVDNGEPVYPVNLFSDLSSLSGLYATINDLRYAFQLEKFLVADALGGTRYREILRQHFNVISPDASQQVPEFLSGKRIPINISQVLQTSSTDDVSPQGNTAAYSLTQDKSNGFTKSFTEHGFVFCVACIRTEKTYSQGVEKFWLRKDKFDYYFPEFANISMQPIYNTEIFNHTFSSSEMSDATFVRDQLDLAKEVFGFQEAWADYRYKPNRISGEFRPQYPQSLDSWHYGEFYESQPYLSAEWIAESRENVERTLAVQDPNVDQFIADFYFDMKCTRVMPVTSVPGLADHH